LNIERHPLVPFLPSHARWLFLGSFPPKQHRWSMDFYYPNFQNDMWRIFGLVFFQDRNHFVNTVEKTFRKEAIIAFLTKQGIAMYDTAEAVIRHKDNASDKNLEIAEPTNIGAFIHRLPHLQSIVTTGQKASEAVIAYFAQKGISINPPAVGAYTPFVYEDRALCLYRMPSSSRAYPLALEKKAEIYRSLMS
jgi:G:T/U-mismatch repair DNA glycosylase